MILTSVFIGCSHARAERHMDDEYGIVCYTYKRAISCVEMPEEEEEDDMYKETIDRE